MSGAGKGREKGDADTPAAEESLNITSLPDLYVGHILLRYRHPRAEVWIVLRRDTVPVHEPSASEMLQGRGWFFSLTFLGHPDDWRSWCHRLETSDVFGQVNARTNNLAVKLWTQGGVGVGLTRRPKIRKSGSVHGPAHSTRVRLQELG